MIVGNPHVVGEGPQLAPCPCCGACSLDEPDEYDICPVCWWEDDGQDNHNADRVNGGPNYQLSLTQARLNFLTHGIFDPDRVDLVALQEPAAKYAQGRVFTISDDARSIAEPAADWIASIPCEED